ncbi:MAG: regulator of sirC expression with transglutaminase-like and TPR domain [Candidatus Paceibacteria bacterium]|jgi:regulator of sirC expression with transglutaminase-like and TPR domain
MPLPSENPHADGRPRTETEPIAADSYRVKPARTSQGASTVTDLRRLRAAGQLIGDDSSEVRSALAREFRQAGKLGRPILKRAAKSSDAHRRSHARSLLEMLRRQAVVRRLLRLCTRDHFDLESAFYLLASFGFADFDSRPYRKALDAMGREVENRTSHLKDDLQRCQVLVHYLGTELKFRGDMDNYTHPDNIYFHRVIERNQGLPLSLCALYSFVARRAGLQTGVIPLPGHVMLRLYGRHQNLIVDPFHGGDARSQDDLVKYLLDHGLRFNPVWMHDASPKLLFARQVANLHNSLRSLGLIKLSRELKPLLKLLGH